MILLEELAYLDDKLTFSEISETIDWSQYRAEELAGTIDLALSLEMASLAIKLAQLGARLFPDNDIVQRAAQVLAPPKAKPVQAPQTEGLDVSMHWLEQHASEHQGKWVAVREGSLLGAAKSLEELETIIGEGKEASSTIVTKVI